LREKGKGDAKAMPRRDQGVPKRRKNASLCHIFIRLSCAAPMNSGSIPEKSGFLFGN
jgi:hypothetical protein